MECNEYNCKYRCEIMKIIANRCKIINLIAISSEKINYNNDRCVFIYLYLCSYIYLFARNAQPLIPLSQVKVSYIYLDFIGPHCNTNLVITIRFSSNFCFNMTPLCQTTFVVLLISVVNVDLFLNIHHL